MNTRQKKIVAGVIAFPFILIGLVVFIFDYGDGDVFESISPTQKGSVYFHGHILWGADLRSCVRDYSISKTNSIELDYLINEATDDYTAPRRVSWSRDGTVVAIRSHDSSQGWDYSYDFLNHRQISPQKNATKTIGTLMKSRGGKGVVVLSAKDRLYDHMSPIWKWQGY